MNNPTPETTILLVEDNLDDIELAYRLFELCSVVGNVRVVNDGQEALDFILGVGAFSAQGRPKSLRLILLDLNLPKISGVEILRALQKDEQASKIPVAVLTITGREKETLEKENFHISAYLRKPLESHSFLNLYNSHTKKP